MARRLTSKRLRNALWLQAGGKCSICGDDLPEDWHADHIVPHSVTGRTNVHEMQALCPACNLRKGQMKLRFHQQKIHDELATMTAERMRDRRTMVVNVWPGGGKSVIPVIAASALMRKKLIQKTVVVVPRLSLKRQGADAFQDRQFRTMLGHNLEVREDCNDVNPDRGTAGYITTYQAIMAAPEMHAQFFRKWRCLLVLDEVHHVGEDSPTHDALRRVFDSAAYRILMTGTLDRNEGGPIAFLHYSAPDLDGKLIPEVDTGYGLQDAVTEKAIIEMDFIHVDGSVTFVDRMGQKQYRGTLTYEADDSRDGIYAALDSDYASQLLWKCVEHWQQWRAAHPESLMLVVCKGIRQATAISSYLQTNGIENAIATSDDSESAQDAIKRYRDTSRPAVLVTVAMAYEGLDVKAITHIACLTHVRSFPWLMQMFGRATRFNPKAGAWETQKAFVFTPDDPLMQQAIDYVREQQTIGIQQQQREIDDWGDSDAPPQSETMERNYVVALDGEATRERASSLWSEQDLGYEETASLKSQMERFNISGSVINMAAMLKECGAGVPRLPGPSSATAERPQPTPGERIDALRKRINQVLSQLDRKTGSSFGTWNKRCFSEVQNYRKREDLSEQDLMRVWEWVARKARENGL